MTEESSDLDERLAAALERVGEALRVQLWDAAKRHGLSPTQLQVLLRLAADPPELRRVGALADRLDVTHPTVSDTLAALRRKGLVEREDERRRRSPLVLSERGRAVAAELADWRQGTGDRLARLDAGDKRAALRVLLGLIAGLQREGTISVARMCSTCRHFRPDAHPNSPQAHHCSLLDLPLAETELRLDCPEHELEAV